jgi:hypothetical protein
MLAADWNEIQVRARTELRTHDHTGDATRIPRDGIADKAIDGSKVDPESRLTVKGLASRPSRSPAPASSPTSRPPSPASAAISGVGTDAPRTAKAGAAWWTSWRAHAKLSIRAGGVDGRVMAHTAASTAPSGA